MYNLLDITAKQEQYRDLLHQAEKERYWREASGQKQHIRPWQTIGWLWALLLLRTG